MYHVIIKPSVEKIFYKLSVKNPKQMQIISDKIEEILKDPHRYKNLRRPLQHLKRVHIDKSFVLTFSISGNYIIIVDYAHHDEIYKS